MSLTFAPKGLLRARVHRLKVVGKARPMVILLLLFVLAGGVLADSKSTMACVPQPLITLAPAASGPVGSQLVASGYSIVGRAEVRWNALDGPLLATATGPTFVVSLTVPDSQPGLYTIVLLERGANGGLGSTGRASFLVTSLAGLPQNDPKMQGESGDGSASLRSRPVRTAVAAGVLVVLLLGILVGRAGRRRFTSTTPDPPPRERSLAEQADQIRSRRSV